MVVLIVEDDPTESSELSAFVESKGHTVIFSEDVQSALGIARKRSPELVLLSMNGHPSHTMEFMDVVAAMEPSPSVIVTTRRASMEDAVQAMKRGAHDFWVKPVSLERLGKTMDWMESKRGSGPQGEAADPFSAPIITRSPAMLRIKAMAKRVAASNATVFIQGESGTGKELFARYIHRHSDRHCKPFIALNCAALPEGLLESELFGHEKGAFTGAIRTKQGKFELAHTGTLLLDEVTEIPVHLQSKLLRVLQENEVDRVGGRYPLPIDVRVIATTNAVAEEATREGRFRKDLYYRLNVIPLKIPPLRARCEDIEALGMYFIEKYNRLHKCAVKGIAPEALKMLRDYSWPGNVRELENVIQRAVLLSNHQMVTPRYLIFDHEAETTANPEAGNGPLSTSPSAADGAMEIMPISEMEKRLIFKALESVSGNRTRAAEILGISVRTLRNKLNEYRYAGGF